MIRKFVTVHGFRSVSAIVFLATVLTGASNVSAQQAPAQAGETPQAQPSQTQTPPAQTPQDQAPEPQDPQSQSQPSAAPQTPEQASPAAPAPAPSQAQQPEDQTAQEASAEDTMRQRKIKPHDYKNWVFNVGGGASLTNGATRTFVRGGGGVVAAGVARNASKYLGLRADFQWDNLPLRNSALQLAQAPGATSYVFSVMLDPIINIPASKNWGGYILIGPSYYHRGGKLDSSSAVPGSACNPFWTWWGACVNGSVPLSGKFLSNSQDEFGYNFGGGVTRKIRSNVDFYVEFRYLHGKHSGITTDLRPITVGVRW
jgi:opacity protein-like surface antigen